MRIAFAIMKLFPGGGLQRDCVEVARRVREGGSEVAIFTSHRHPGDFACDLPVTVLPVRARTNHRMQQEFAGALRHAASRQDFDLLVGFDKLTDLDLLYCADPSIRFRMTNERFRFLLPRYRAYVALERASFGAASATQVLMLSHTQLNEYWKVWHTAPERLTVLPPTISALRRHPEFRRGPVRSTMRERLGVASHQRLWLAVGVQAHTKGLDRIIRAMRAFPAVRLVVVGLLETSTSAARTMAALARRYGVTDRILWIGHREDISELMAASDLLVHPARRDTTGTVILEAVVNGLPVITTSVCGYAHHVDAAQAGIVIKEPFNFEAFEAALATAQDARRRARWSAAGEQYGSSPALYEGRARAADHILAAAAERIRLNGAAVDANASADVVYLHEAMRHRRASAFPG
jgi:UDP-glucose:(heptosyl)LPS alpha-1,3-glucosyltransferase